MTSSGQKSSVHAAEGAALGFYYQAYFALLTLVAQGSDHAGIALERLDDVELTTDGHKLLFQLKHSIKATPPPVTLKARALWRTVKVWVDILPSLTLAETTLHLVAVGKIPEGSPLRALTDLEADRSDLVSAMVAEAEAVIAERSRALEQNARLPYEDRADGCEAFLALQPTERLNLLRRALIYQNSPSIGQVEVLVAEHLKLILPEQRAHVAKRLLGWWDTEVIYALCGKRDPVITRAELQAQVSQIISDLEDGKLLPDFELQMPPQEYQPDGMLARQIHLVGGKDSDLKKAIREEWRAREQRAQWLNNNPSMGTTITTYDYLLEEEWSDRHVQMTEECQELTDAERRKKGLELLRWTHETAPASAPPELSQGMKNPPPQPGVIPFPCVFGGRR